MSTETQLNVGSNLIRIHRVITRAVKVALESCEQYLESGFPDTATQNGYQTYVHCLVTTLHGHHLAEDNLAFPCFKLKLPGAPFEKLEEEHRRMQPMLEAIKTALDNMTADPNSSLKDLHKTLSDLSALWKEHMGGEEDHFSCQVLAAAMKSEEHMKLGKDMAEHAQKHSEPGYLTLPFILFNLPPDERAIISQMIPSEIINHLVPVVWKDKWEPMKPFLLD